MTISITSIIVCVLSSMKSNVKDLHMEPHAHEDVTRYLQSEDLKIIPHSPYSPDLSPCDFWLFDLIKENLADQNDSVSLHDAVTDFMYSLNQGEYRKTFEKWVERMELCIENQGDYFEHLLK